jgi:hypothetical protein
LQKARRVRWDGTPDDLAQAAASNDIAAVGRLLGSRDVNMISFNEGNLPEPLARRLLECSLLDVRWTRVRLR